MGQVLFWPGYKGAAILELNGEKVLVSSSCSTIKIKMAADAVRYMKHNLLRCVLECDFFGKSTLCDFKCPDALRI